ncbi:hypothetical protein [Longimicrobium sp.]|uniref:hypothetical protein n=1 Tax=Longimicrobium sp. TaxID=2029185 RepID=UPI003B3BD923
MLRFDRLAPLLLLAAAPAVAQQPIAVGRSVAGELAATDSVGMDEKRYDAWVFAGEAGRFYRITLRSEDFDAYLWAGPQDDEYADDCELCERDDDGAGEGDAQLLLPVEDAGPMVIRVTTYEAGEVGRYTLQVEETEAPPPDPDAPPPLANSGGGRLLPGITASGVLTRGDAQAEGSRPPEEDAYYDVWTYRGTAGEPLTILMSSDSFDTFLRMGRRVDGRWRQVAANDDAGAIGDSKLTVTLPEGGEYEVHAGAYREHATGTYTLTAASGAGGGGAVAATPLVPMDELPILMPGRGKDGELAAGDAVGEEGALYDAWRYFASAGETATFELASEEFDAVLRIGVRENGVWREVARDDDGGGGTQSELTITFPAQAEYEIRAGTFAAGADGAYSLFGTTDIHADIEARAPPGTLTVGHTSVGRLEDGDERGEDGMPLDVWTMLGSEGNTLKIDLRSNDFDPLVRVFAEQPDGGWRMLGENDDDGVGTDSRLIVTLPANGKYRIHATAYREEARGQYRLSVNF